MIRVDREHPLDKPLGTHSIVAQNIRNWAKDEKQVLPSEVTDHDIMNVYHFLVRVGARCDEDTVIAYLMAGVVAFGYDHHFIVAVDRNGQVVPAEKIHLPE